MAAQYAADADERLAGSLRCCCFTDGAAFPGHCYVDPAEAETMVQGIRDGHRLQLLCCGRQTGKSTVALAVRHKLIAAGIHALYMDLSFAMLSTDVNESALWAAIFSDLCVTIGGQRFNTATAVPSAAVFQELCRADPPLCVIMDGACQLASMGPAVAEAFLKALRGLQDNPQAFKGAILVGMYDLLDALRNADRHTKNGQGASAGAQVGCPPSCSTALTAHEPPSFFQRNLCIGIANFTEPEVQQLFEQFRQQLAARRIAVPDGWVRTVVSSIYTMTLGNRGLVGACGTVIQENIQAFRGHSQPITDWNSYAKNRLLQKLGVSIGYQHISSMPTQVFPFSVVDTPALPQDQLAKAALESALMHGYFEAKLDELPIHLLRESVLVVLGPTGLPSSDVLQLVEDGGSSSSSGGGSRSVVLGLAAPLVAHEFLSRLGVQLSKSQLLGEVVPPSIIGAEWLLDMVVQHMRPDRMCGQQASVGGDDDSMSSQGSSSCGDDHHKPSKYAYHSHFVLLCNSILEALSVAQRVQYEFMVETDVCSLAMDGGGSNMRSEISVTARGVPTLGFKLLAYATEAELEEHVRAAQKQHVMTGLDQRFAQLSQEASVVVVERVQERQDEVMVVNFEVEADGANPKMHFPVCGKGVQVCTVVLSRQGGGAWIYSSLEKYRAVRFCDASIGPLQRLFP